MLTGESQPARKTVAPVAEHLLAADRASMTYMGTAVASGRGRGIVVGTGTDTQLGAIAESIRQEEQPQTPLQQRMGRFANIIGIAVLASSAATFVLGLALGGAVDEMFLTAVALAVAVVPEGLPVAFTVAMALGVSRMAMRHALIRSLPAVETLGSTDVIGSDKTGTLTANQMTVLRAWTPDGWVSFHRDGEDVLGDGYPDAVDHRGDPTESARLEAARNAGVGPTQLRDEVDTLARVPFESDLRYSYEVVDERGPVLRLKGAPERVLDLCSTSGVGDAEAPLDHDEVLAAAEAMAHRGLRVLAMAERRLDVPVEEIEPESPPAPASLALTGLVGMQDPPRHGVRDAIERCRQAGIRVVMITGDHVATARAIARDVGISEGEAMALTGSDVEDMSDEELRSRVLEVDVFARVAPEHKAAGGASVRSHDQVVAVTGDGVNDGPALKAADIGVAMGRSGTDVAREASDMVLTDDNFVSIAKPSRKAGSSSTTSAFDKGEPDVLDRPPRRRAEGIVNRVLWERTVLTGMTMAVGSLWLFRWAMDAGLTDAQQRGAALTTLVVAMGAHVYNARSERRSIVVTHVRGNLFLLVSTIVAFSIHLAASYWGPTQTVLPIEPVTGAGWARIAVVAVAVVLVSELHKLLRSRLPDRARRRGTTVRARTSSARSTTSSG